LVPWVKEHRNSLSSNKRAMKKMNRHKRSRTIELLKLEKKEIERRINKIRASKQKKIMSKMDGSYWLDKSIIQNKMMFTGRKTS